MLFCKIKIFRHIAYKIICRYYNHQDIGIYLQEGPCQHYHLAGTYNSKIPDKTPCHFTIIFLFSKKLMTMGIKAGLTLFLIKEFMAKVGHCFGKACFQLTKVEITAITSPWDFLSIADGDLSNILTRQCCIDTPLKLPNS